MPKDKANAIFKSRLPSRYLERAPPEEGGAAAAKSAFRVQGLMYLQNELLILEKLASASKSLAKVARFHLKNLVLEQQLRKKVGL